MLQASWRQVSERNITPTMFWYITYKFLIYHLQIILYYDLNSLAG